MDTCWDVSSGGVRQAVRLGRLGAWGGIAGPLLFTAAWAAGSLRQAGHPATAVQLSGLGAEDARDPQIMIAGFVVLGVCSIGFGAALRRAPGTGTAGPWLVMAGGVAAVAAGAFRRDRMLLSGPGFDGESWHNQVHDVVSGVAYAAMLAAPLVLAWRFRAEPRWAVIARPVQVLALASAAALAVFASDAVEPWDGTVQRTSVTLALAAEALIAARMLHGDIVAPVLAEAAFIGFVPVRDLAAARAFYEGTLGLRVVGDTPFALVLDAGGTMLRVTPVPELAARPFTVAGWKVPDIASAVRALAGRGVEFTRYDGMAQDDLGIWTAPGGDRVAWFSDPDGNTLSLTTFAAT